MNESPSNGAPQSLADTVFRIFGSLIFVTAGAGHLLQPDAIVNRLTASPIGTYMAALVPAELLVLSTGAVLLVAGIALLLGAGTRLAAVVLIVCLIPITISVQLAPGQTGPLFKNIALLGMLIHFAVAGAAHHRLAFDALIERRRRSIHKDNEVLS